MVAAFGTKTRTGPMVCGFCQSGNHNHCPRGVRNGNGRVIACGCDAPYCGGQVIRCLNCKNENDGEVSPDGWLCLDREACALEVQRRLDSNVHVRMVREVMARVSEQTATEEKAAQATKAPTYCLHCGEVTKGGKFLPGHDAKFVATQVLAVVDQGTTTAEAVLADMKERGATEALQTKFTKSVDLARKDRERRAKLAQEKADQKAAAAQKAEADKAAGKAAAKAADASAPGEEPVVVTPDTDPEQAKTATPKAKKA